MNIVREQRGENNSLIRVTVGEADYGQEVEKSLREYKRKANIPGFRPGMVPMGIVKKMYGKGVLAEQSYRQASNAVFEYLQKEGIDYLGDVIPAEEQGDFDFDNATEFEFVFEIGEAPEIKLELSDKLGQEILDELCSYGMLNRISIQISDECVDAYAVQAIPVIIPVLYFAGELIRDGSSYSLCAPIRSSPLLRETAVREGASARAASPAGKGQPPTQPRLCHLGSKSQENGG